MLRQLFGDPERQDTGLLPAAMSALRVYRNDLRRLIRDDSPLCGRYTRFDLWTRGFAIAMDELEQSAYAANKFRAGVRHSYEEAMTPEETLDYRRHVYFYKNAIIRVFSILDKLGYFLNDLFGLRTERVKQKFSYFTVLRQMQHLNAVPELSRTLHEIKAQHQPALGRLRHKRNMEIHLINSEMVDDLLRTDLCRADRTYVDDLDANLADLAEGFEMVCRTLIAVFQYAHERHKV